MRLNMNLLFALLLSSFKVYPIYIYLTFYNLHGYTEKVKIKKYERNKRLFKKQQQLHQIVKSKY